VIGHESEKGGIRVSRLGEAVVSITKDGHTPFVSQRGPDGRLNIIGREIQVRVLNTASEFSRLETERVFGPFGIWRWRAKTYNPQTNTNIYMGFYSGVGTGWIDFRQVGTAERVTCSVDGVTSLSTTLTGTLAQVWTTEKEFKIDWESNRLRFYVDGALIATHTTRIPVVAMPFFCKVENGSTAPAATSGVDFVRSTLERV